MLELLLIGLAGLILFIVAKGSWPTLWSTITGGSPFSADVANAPGSSSSSTQSSQYSGNAGTLNANDIAAIGAMGYQSWANAHNAAIASGAQGYTYDPSTPPSGLS